MALTRILLRKDTEARLISFNPLIKEGEFVVATDKNYFKIGNGTQTFNQLTEKYIGYTEILALKPAITLSTSDPDANRDVSEGYRVGNLWLNTGTSPIRLFFCANASESGAVWTLIATGGGSSSNSSTLNETTLLASTSSTGGVVTTNLATVTADVLAINGDISFTLNEAGAALGLNTVKTVLYIIKNTVSSSITVNLGANIRLPKELTNQNFVINPGDSIELSLYRRSSETQSRLHYHGAFTIGGGGGGGGGGGSGTLNTTEYRLQNSAGQWGWQTSGLVITDEEFYLDTRAVYGTIANYLRLVKFSGDNVPANAVMDSAQLILMGKYTSDQEVTRAFDVHMFKGAGAPVITSGSSLSGLSRTTALQRFTYGNDWPITEPGGNTASLTLPNAMITEHLTNPSYAPTGAMGIITRNNSGAGDLVAQTPSQQGSPLSRLILKWRNP